MTIEEAQNLEQYVCSECSPNDERKKSHAIVPAVPKTDTKVRFSSLQ